MVWPEWTAVVALRLHRAAWGVAARGDFAFVLSVFVVCGPWIVWLGWSDWAFRLSSLVFRRAPCMGSSTIGIGRFWVGLIRAIDSVSGCMGLWVA